MSKDGTNSIYEPRPGEEVRRHPGDAVVAAFGDGRELRVRFSNHAASRGGVSLRSEYVAPDPPDASQGGDPGARTTFASIVIRPGGGSLMAVAVDAVAADGSTVAVAGTLAEGAGLFVIDGESRARMDSELVVMHFADGRDLAITMTGTRDAAAPPPMMKHGWVGLIAGPQLTRAEYEASRDGGPLPWSRLRVSFGAGNVVHVAIDRHDGVLANRTPPPDIRDS